MNFGENLCKARKLKGMSQEEMAGHLNVSRQSVSFWENNQTVPSLENLISICNLLEINSSILLGQEEFPDEKKERERLMREEDIRKKVEEEKKERERKIEIQKEKEFKTETIISFVLAMLSTLLAFIPVVGIIPPIISLVLAIKTRKYKHNNLNLISLIFSIVYIIAAICFIIFIFG